MIAFTDQYKSMRAKLLTEAKGSPQDYEAMCRAIRTCQEILVADPDRGGHFGRSEGETIFQLLSSPVRVNGRRVILSFLYFKGGADPRDRVTLLDVDVRANHG